VKQKFIAMVCLLALSLPLGCLPGAHQLRVIPSPGVETIPTVIGIHPFLSVSATRRGPGTSATMSHRVDEHDVYIAPPAGSKLIVTPYSQMFTAFVSGEMANYGFDLRELPVEIPKGDNAIGQSKNEFVISLALLHDLQENYGLEAVLIGNVYFVGDPQDPVNQLVSAAYAKLIEVETLKVLSQFSLPFNSSGSDMEDVAEWIAVELAVMAGLATRVPEGD
jgi:hypothetical protein